MTQTDSLLVVVSQGEIDRTHAAMKDAIRRAENAEAQLADARAQIAALKPLAKARQDLLDYNAAEEAQWAAAARAREVKHE